jgi:hypothetical protein
MLLTQIPNVLANSGNVSKEIERIEISENCKTIYYTDGSAEVFVTAVANLNFHTSTSVTYTPIPITPLPIPIDKILRIIKQILDTLNTCGAGDVLLAFIIWNTIKRLRRGRPRDYHGIEWHTL